jgi:hypothetical protein
MQATNGLYGVNGDNTITYSPAIGFYGTNRFLYIVSDGQGGLATGAVSVAVAPIRVTDGLQVLYLFREGTGSSVTDVSGVGSALNLRIRSTNAVAWSTNGLSVQSPTIVTSAVAPQKILAACKASNELTVEAWIRPASRTNEYAPEARIVTLSASATLANFTLHQVSNFYEMRLRTTDTDSIGIMPGDRTVATAAGTVTTSLTHVVATRTAAGTLSIYLNGELTVSDSWTGAFSNWNETYLLALANELTFLSYNAAWRGDYRIVAVYSRALTAAEARRNFAVGPTP